jgi:hypothetical protein
MSTFRVKSIWTAFVTVLVALLASLGLATAQAAEPTVTNQKHTGAAPATSIILTAQWALPRDSALPPTMKQRIRAEAHGSSPAVRQLSTDTADTTRTVNSTRSIPGTAPAGNSAPLPP